MNNMAVFYDFHQKPHSKPADEPVVWRPSAYGVLEDKEGRWLFVEPTWTKRLDLPGGGVEHGELITKGLAREFYEETGYKVLADELPAYVGQSNFVHKNLGYCHCILFIYRVSLISDHRDEDVVNTFDDGYEIANSLWIHPSKTVESDVSPIIWPYIKNLQGL
ncbi:MAG: NUDIX hydrolase [Candidatus Uhrbacteria bacterium]|nr:NUDIX hydrolase [Candidatus Uhrbacteria bacterium]